MHIGKKELDIIPDVKSKDKYNRKTPSKDIKIPNLPSNSTDNDYINIGSKYVNKHFKNNYGNTDNFLYPLTHKTANKWLKEFIDEKFKDFGPYQDYIDKDKSFLFHSILSTSINIGLLNPSDIIDEIIIEESRLLVDNSKDLSKKTDIIVFYVGLV